MCRRWRVTGEEEAGGRCFPAALVSWSVQVTTDLRTLRPASLPNRVVASRGAGPDATAARPLVRRGNEFVLGLAFRGRSRAPSGTVCVAGFGRSRSAPTGKACDASRECGRERPQAGMPVSPVGLRGALGHAERVAVAARSSGGSVRVSARGGASRASTDAEAPPRADTRRRAWVGPSLREAQVPTQPRHSLSSGVATSSSSAWRSGVGPERRAGPFASRGSAGPARRSGPTGKACDALAGVREGKIPGRYACVTCWIARRLGPC